MDTIKATKLLNGLILIMLILIFTSCDNNDENEIDNCDTCAPSISTVTINRVFPNAATSGGVIINNHNVPIIAKGVCWSVFPNPTTADNTTNDVESNDDFSSLLSNLSPDTEYFVRAYVTTNNETVYGDEISFISYPQINNGIVEGNFSIYTQEEFDWFNSNIEINIVNGDFIINKSNLITIYGFNNLVTVTGHVAIFENDFLENMSGFDNLTDVGKSLYIVGNQSLEHITGFNNLEIIQDMSGLQLSQNFSLLSLTGLISLQSLPHVWMADNYLLNNITGLNNLTTAPNLFIIGNGLVNLNGLNSLSYVDELFIAGNQTLTDFCDLQNLMINGNFSGSYHVEENAFNPTQQDIINGNCSQ
jgi:hypothetical protein